MSDLEQADLYLENHLLLSDGAARELCGALLARAEEGSWRAVRRLIALSLEKRPGTVPERVTGRAVALLEEAASAGHVEAMTLLGSLCRDGHLVHRVAEHAEDWLGRAWEKGGTDAGCELVEMHWAGRRTPPKMKELCLGAIADMCAGDCARAHALKARMIAAEAAGQPLSAEDRVRVESLLRRAARLGLQEPFARHAVGLLVNARGRAERERCLSLVMDPCLADWKLLPVQKGLLRLSGMDGRAPDAEAGLALLAEAARAGTGRACGMLAGIWLHGLYTVPKDLEKGAEWLAAGWERHDPRSVMYLALDRTGYFGGSLPMDNPLAGQDTAVWVQWCLDRRDMLARALAGLRMGTCRDMEGNPTHNDDREYAGQLCDHGSWLVSDALRAAMTSLNAGIAAYLADAFAEMTDFETGPFLAESAAHNAALTPRRSCAELQAYCLSLCERLGSPVIPSRNIALSEIS
ncbi:MAG: hypothetical protein Q4F72_08440 [Desulfovibrionaceae bacterium]|nr:hypothetical protein [Desulfovibrionaceae bacterium]